MKKNNPWIACAAFLVSLGLYFYYFIIASLAGGLLEGTLYSLIIYAIFFLLISLGLFLKPFKGFAPVLSLVLLGYGAFLSFLNARGYLVNLGRVFKSSVPLGISSIVELILVLLFLAILVFLALRLAFREKAWASKLGASVFFLLLAVALGYFVQTIAVGVAYHATNSFKLIFLSLYPLFLYLGLAFVYRSLTGSSSPEQVPGKAQ